MLVNIQFFSTKLKLKLNSPDKPRPGESEAAIRENSFGPGEG